MLRGMNGAAGPLFNTVKQCYNRHVPEFRILGPLEVAAETGPLALGGQKQRAVLAVLLLEANRVVSVDRLLDSVWGEHPPKTALTSLQNFISQLRKLLGPDVLETRAPGYRLMLMPSASQGRTHSVTAIPAHRRAHQGLHRR